MIFNSENNFSENLIIDFNFLQVKVNNLYIINIFNKYIEVDFDVDNVLEIEKMQQVFSKKVEKIKVYPDFENNKIFFILNVFSFTSFKEKAMNYKLFCKIPCILSSDGVEQVFETNYQDYCKIYEINDEERALIQKYSTRQKQPHWFNDQNLFVEREYFRIKKLTSKKKEEKAEGIFDPSVVKTSIGPSDPLGELSKIIGLKNVKHEVKRLKAVLEYRKQNNMQNQDSLHMCFYGNPGTGKTTVARIMAGILYELGYIRENKCVEINGLELKGANAGQTSIITKSIIDYSKGGVLFVDEAYTLFDESKNNFGTEAINSFLKEMEDNRQDLIVIFAGYYGPMQRLLDSNVGFRSRIKHYFDFEDYSAAELFEIFMNLLKNKHLYIEPDAMEEVILLFKNARQKRSFGNGRFVENFILKMVEEHILNVSKNISKADFINVKDIVKEGDIFDM